MSRSANTVILLAALISWGALHAQDVDRDDQQAETTEQQPSDATDSADVDKITVSATRRSDSIDSVPVAVTAIDGDTLEESGVRDLQALQTLSPSLYISVAGSEAGSGVMRIRGIGTSGISNPGLEPAVGLFIDGVYRPRPGAALGDLVGIDQIEVMRGPQSTLFGKNTSAGAISIQTKKPDFLPGAEVWAGAGNRDAWIAGSSITGGIIDDRLAMRLDVQAQKKDGYIDNVRGGTINDRDRWLVRAQALFTPSANVDVRLVVDYAEKDEKCCAPTFTIFGPTAPAIQAVGGTIFDEPREFDVAIDRTPSLTDENLGISAHLDWDFQNGVSLNAIVSHREWTANSFGDVDYTDADIAYYEKNEIESNFDSAEFTLAGEYGRVDWLVGAFYGSQDTDTDARLLFGADAGAFLSLLAGGAVPPAVFPEGTGQTRIGFNQDADSWSVFTHNEIDLGRDWTLTLGARYLDESKSGGGVVESNAPGCQIPGIPPALQLLCPAPAYNASFDDDEVVGTAGINKMYGDSGMVYLKYSRGYKAGGLNLAPTASLGGDVAALTFEPETVDAYELGLKQGFLGNRLNLRTAVFYSEFEDFQLNFFDGVSFSISNAASAESKGVEVELDYRVFNGLRLRGGVTYTDATFGHDTINEALRGKQVTNAAEWSGMAGVYYQRRLEFADASVFGNLVVRGQSETNTGADLDPNKRQGGYALVNSRVGLRFGSNWEVALWANNLTDREYNMVIIDAVIQPGSFQGFKGEPRTWGISVRKSFW